MENSQHVLQLFPLAIHAILIEASRKLSFPIPILPTFQPLVIIIHFTAGVRYAAFGEPGDLLQALVKGRHVNVSVALIPHLVGFSIQISICVPLNLRGL